MKRAARVTCTRLRPRQTVWRRCVDGPRNDRSASPESCGCLARATRNISPRLYARTNERAPLRWGVIYVAEGGNCPRILCPACPRGHTFQPAVSTVNNVPRVVPKRFLVSAVILAINRGPPPLKYRVSSRRVCHSLLLMPLVLSSPLLSLFLLTALLPRRFFLPSAATHAIPLAIGDEHNESL